MKSLTTRLLLFLSMPLLLLCACHTTCPAGSQSVPQVLSESLLQPLALPEDAEVLAFDGEHILFCRQENTSDESAHALFRCDISGGEIVRLWGYPAPAYSGDAAVLRGQDLYLLTEGAVCQVDVSSGAATEIAEVPTEAMVSLHAMDNGLVLHSILSEENGGLTYLVETLSLPEGQRRTVAKEQVRDNSGTAISCVAAQGETIYTYEVQLTSSAPEYRLSTYRTDGTPLGQYALDLADLLPASGDLAQDAVIGLEVRGNCVLLHTLNARTRALVLAEGELRPVSVPPTLEESLPGGYRLLPQWDPDSPALFFASAAPALYRFNAQTQTFSPVLLSEDIPQNVTWHGSCGQVLLFSAQQDGQGRGWYLLRVDLA